MTSRISVNVNGDAPNLDLNRLIGFVNRLRPGWLLVKNNLDVALALAAQYPSMQVIYRQWPDDDRPMRQSPASYITEMAGKVGSHPNVWACSNNESGFKPSVLSWLGDVIDLAVSHNLKVVVGNFSTGTPEPNDWTRADALDFLRAASANRDHVVIGLHEYAIGVITSGFVGGTPVDPSHPNYIPIANWPANARPLTKWHCGRFNFLVQTCEAKGIPVPRLLVTEHGFDDVSDLKAWAQSIPRDGDIKGWRTLGKAWHEWYPQWSHEQAYAEQLLCADRAIYQGTAVEGQLIFCWGDSGGWSTLDIQSAGELQDRLVQAASSNEPPPVVWIDAIARLSDGSVNLRSQPTADSASLALISAGQPIEYEGDAVNGWWHIRLGDKVGYCDSRYFTPVVGGEPPEPLPALDFSVPIAELGKIIASLTAIRDWLATL